MAGNDFNQKYTIERYCTKADIIKAFGTTLIEPIWREIISFRNRMGIELPFFDASHIKFGLTYIDSVQAKSSQANDRVASFIGSYGKIAVGSLAESTFTTEMIKISLKEIAKLNKLDVSEITLTNIIQNEPVGEEYKVLVNYYRALIALRNSGFESIDEAFLARNYAMLRGEEELTSFYRESDNQSSASRFIINREYDQGVPAHLIDVLMPPVLDYINNTQLSLVSRLAAIFFMFNYIKPFESHNMELAALLAKKVIGSTNIDTGSIYIPLEVVLNDADLFGPVSNETKKTHDFTYVYLKTADLVNSAFDVALSRMSEVRANSLDIESKIGSNNKSIEEEFKIKVELPKKKEQKTETKSQIIERIEKNAPKTTENNLSEKELRAKAQDILESDPYIKKGQAHFYVHHCTVGKYYTIQQYVKFEKVVYETARTSMDNLAKRGYYRRDNVKNKFVYTPINKE